MEDADAVEHLQHRGAMYERLTVLRHTLDVWLKLTLDDGPVLVFSSGQINIK